MITISVTRTPIVNLILLLVLLPSIYYEHRRRQFSDGREGQSIDEKRFY